MSIPMGDGTIPMVVHPELLDQLRERTVVGGGIGLIYADELARVGILPVWRPIATAPVPPREELRWGRWRCLLTDRKGTVVAGFAAYARIQGKADRWRLQWYAGNGIDTAMFGNKVFVPTHWMPLPKGLET